MGGLFPNSSYLNEYAFSQVYVQDEMIWCVQTARNMTMFINILFAASPEVWILLIFGVGYGSGLLLYVMIQFDFKYKHRNNRDWHYTTWLVALPAVIGVSQRFYPKHDAIRLYYGLLLIMMVFAWQIFMWRGLRFIYEPTKFYQPNTVKDIIDFDFRLVGSANVLSMLSMDKRVIGIFFYKLSIHIELRIHFFSFC